MAASPVADIAAVGTVTVEFGFDGLGAPPAAGRTVHASGFELQLGGALRIARAAKELGATAALCAPVGQDVLGYWVAQRLESLGLHHHLWHVSGGHPALVARLGSGDGAAWVDAARLECLRDAPALPVTRCVHVNGLPEAVALARQLQTARLSGAQVSVSASWHPELLARLRDESAIEADVLFMRQDQAAEASGERDPRAAARALATANRLVVVTCGADGAAAVLGASEAWVEGGPSEETENGKGAFAARFLVASLRGGTLEQALEAAQRGSAR